MRNLSFLIPALLALSSVGAGRARPDPAPPAIEQLLQRQAQAYDQAAAKKERMRGEEPPMKPKSKRFVEPVKSR